MDVFLNGRHPNVSLKVQSWVPEWGTVPSGAPQGTKLGAWLFHILINNLNLGHNLNVQPWMEYVDGTTSSRISSIVRISFARNQPKLQPIAVNGQKLEVVHSEWKTSWYHSCNFIFK